jgi:ABC-type arginine/histidine transport system permease subunit
MPTKSFNLRSALRFVAIFAAAFMCFAILSPEAHAQSLVSSANDVFATPASKNSGAGLVYGIVEMMRWVFSILYIVSVYYLIKAAQSYSEEQYDKMWAQIGATVFYAVIPTVAHLVWAIGKSANSKAGGGGVFG